MTKHDVCKFLAATHRRLHDGRRIHEWRFFFAELALMAGAVVIVMSEKAPLQIPIRLPGVRAWGCLPEPSTNPTSTLECGA
jgi:hypothetical protein